MVNVSFIARVGSFIAFLLSVRQRGFMKTEFTVSMCHYVVYFCH